MLREAGKRPSRYHVFVLSLWEEGAAFAGEGVNWRFSLEQAQGVGRKGFSSLQELMAYLDAWTHEPPDQVSGGQGHHADTAAP
ncbi:MAG: hypothetical protein FJ011_18225 [Chloroflexi bacterium]|nr:hypothetical protein [Chloroflexota bacterium]